MSAKRLPFLPQLMGLLIAMFASGLIAILLGKELHWDLANYHYYHPYAFLHHRLNLDYWPPNNFPMYFNPTLDLLSYALIQFCKPISATFLLGAIHGINIWLMYLISFRLLQDHEKIYAHYIAILLAIVCMYGPVSFAEIGSFMGDNSISIFILTAILLQILALQTFQPSKTDSYRYLILSGVSLGLAVGLKLTAGLFIAGFILSILILPLPFFTKIKMIIDWSIASLLGQCMTSGYWMIFLWQHYHNPFFPLFNGIFKSAAFPTTNIIDVRFFPTSILQTLFYPFYFASSGQVTDARFIDYRFPILYLCLVATFLKWGIEKWKNAQKKIVETDYSFLWLISFFIFTYIIWQITSSNLRYIDALQIIAPLLIYKLVIYLIKPSALRFVIFITLFYAIVNCMVPMGIARLSQYDGNYFNITLPKDIDHTPQGTVLVAFSNLTFSKGLRPLSYLIPSFPPAWRFIGIPFTSPETFILSDKTASLLKGTKQLYLLANEASMPAFFLAAKELGYQKMGACEPIISDRDPSGTLLCAVKKN